MSRHDLYTMNIDRRKNYYNYRRFGHITRNYRNMRIVEQGRRISYQGNNEHLKEEESLVALD